MLALFSNSKVYQPKHVRVILMFLSGMKKREEKEENKIGTYLYDGKIDSA